MVSGEAVSANVQEYAATSMNLQTKNEIFSAMVVYGFLSFEKGRVSIPNRESMEKFDDILGKVGEEKEFDGRILAVGIGYDKKDKKHTCKVEWL